MKPFQPPFTVAGTARLSQKHMLPLPPGVIANPPILTQGLNWSIHYGGHTYLILPDPADKKGIVLCVIDKEDWETVSNYRWSCTDSRNHPSEPPRLYAVATIKGKHVRMHRMLLGVSRSSLVDHENSDSLDNRRSNLRVATTSQNLANSGKRRGGKNPYKGVEFHYGKWRAVLGVNSKKQFVGRFDTPEEAARAYDAAAIAAFGSFARPNFPASR